VASASGLRRVPIQPIFAQLIDCNILTPEAATLIASAINHDALRTIPGIHPCDGFFAAVLERN
jgi:16S rRNA (cytosine967-C5)-methyltransferase